MADRQEALVMSVSRAAALLDMGEPQIRILAREGKLKAVKIGRTWRINCRSVYELVGEQPLQGQVAK